MAETELMTKGEVNYTSDASNHSEECHLCKYFHAPRACEIVKGAISPHGWCERFEKRNE